MSAVGLSVDVDSVATHLAGYGVAGVCDDGSAYRIAIPRILEMLARNDARCTFFLIASEAARFPEVVRSIAERGHEVASHSYSHPVPFQDLARPEMVLEMQRSREVLESLAGTVVSGFRAPSWGVSPQMVSVLEEVGYQYDASEYPGILRHFMRMAVALRSERAQTPRDRPRVRRSGGRQTGRVRAIDGGAAWEIPVCKGAFGFPYYHTMRVMAPAWLFRLIERRALRRRPFVRYVCHAVDFMGMTEDRLDPRIGRHPGMQMCLHGKLELAQEAMGALKSAGRIVPLVEVLEGAKGSLEG